MKTAVIYARYSSNNQTEQSIEGQVRVCQEYAKQHDILIIGQYIDRAISGTTDKRPDFQQMLIDSKKKEWNYVLVYRYLHGPSLLHRSRFVDILYHWHHVASGTLFVILSDGNPRERLFV